MDFSAIIRRYSDTSQKIIVGLLSLLTAFWFLSMPAVAQTAPMVRLIYFLPKDRTAQPNIIVQMDTMIKEAQELFAVQMNNHGFGRKTFQFETDANGNAVIHRVNGMHNDVYYHDNTGLTTCWDEVEAKFDMTKNVYLIVLDISVGQIDLGHRTTCGIGGTNLGNSSIGGDALITVHSYCFDADIVAHELGHTFGLQHDYRPDKVLLPNPYTSDVMLTSYCAAEWLDVNPYFNTGKSFNRNTTIIMSDLVSSPPDAIRFSFDVTDTDGLRQAQLLGSVANEQAPGVTDFGVIGCEALDGTSDTVEFVTSQLRLDSTAYNLSLRVIDNQGNFTESVHSINVADALAGLLPTATPVSMPDANLAAAVRSAIGLGTTDAITEINILNLRSLHATEQQITNLTGLEYAINLWNLQLGKNQIRDLTPLANLTGLGSLSLSENQIDDLTPLANLTDLRNLALANNRVVNLSPLTALTQLEYLLVSNNQIRDITPLANLTDLRFLYFGGNRVLNLSPLTGLTELKRLNAWSNQNNNISLSDISPLANLTELEHLGISNNQISDITPLADLTELEDLWISSNQISDISPLANLMDLRNLALANNRVVNLSPLTALTQLERLYAWNNQIDNISPLANLTQLTDLDLRWNRISDVSSVSGLVNLERVWLVGNQITDTSPLVRFLIQNPDVEIDVSVNTQVPDLRVKSVNVVNNKSTVAPGATFQLDVVIENQGKANSTQTSLRYYISTDETISTTDTQEHTGTLPSIAGSVTHPLSVVELTAPDPPGTYYYGVCIDVVAGESDTTNNCSEAVEITVENLAPIAVGTIPPQTLSKDDRSIEVDVAGNFNDPNNTPLIYTAVSDNTQVATVGVNSSKITITRVGAGDATVTVTASDGVLTSPEQEFSVSVMAKPPDLHIVDVSVDLDKDTVAPGRAFQLTAVLNNQGEADASATTVRYYISTDGTISTTDTSEHTVTLPSIAGSVTHPLSAVELTAPDPPGTYYYGVCIDVVASESDTTNNCSDAVEITVENLAPIAVGTIPPQRLSADDRFIEVDVAGNFNDPNNTPLIYTVVSDNTQVATVDVSDSKITITSVGSGRAMVTITASDGALTVEQTFEVRVWGEADWMPDAELRKLVRSTLGLTENDVLTTAALTGLTKFFARATEIQDLTGLEHATQLEVLELYGVTGLTNITPLQGLTNLSELAIAETDIADMDISPLRGLTNLSTLMLTENSIEDISPLQGLTNLSKLTISQTGVTNISPLRGLTNLSYLYLRGTGITNISPLRGLTNLSDLYLVETPNITDIPPLQRLTNLSTLSLVETGITDISSLQGLTALKYLTLQENPISDIGPLAGLTTLLSLTLMSNPITDFDPIRRLLEKNPNVILNIDGRNDWAVPDLHVVNVSLDKNSVGTGETFQFTTVLTNQGNVDAQTINVRYYLSTDDTISETDTPSRTDTIERLAFDATVEPSVELVAPDIPGTYYYGVCVDPYGRDLDTTNNCSEGIEITVEAPSNWDLMIEGTPEVNDTTFTAGDTFEITTHVWNKGNAVSETTTLHYYLSTDATILPEDTLLSSDSINALSGKGAHPSRRRAELSATLTAPDTPGTYYLGVCIDAVDADTSNNCSQAIEITVAAPAPEPVVAPVPGESGNPEPVEIQGPDLVFSMTRVDASTIKVFAGVRFHITLTNQGTEMAAATTIRYYRSEDATISAEDTELRAVPIGQLGGGRSQTTWALLPGSTSVGTYYYGACVDGVESEFDTTNNCSDGIEITVERQGEGTPQLRPVGTISTQELEVGGSPVVVNVSDYFFGEVESYTASSNKTEVVTVSMSDSEVTLTAVGEGWATVSVTASSGDLAAKQTFSVSVGGAAVPEPTVPDTSGPDLSPEVSIPDANLRAAVRAALNLEEGDTLTQEKMSALTQLDRTHLTTGYSPENLTGLEYATNLESLTLQLRPSTTDITPLANLTKLTHLTLNIGGITDLRPLTNLTKLTRLELSANDITDITPLANLTKLTFLALWGNDITDIRPLANLTKLTHLTLNDSSITDITPLTNLTELTLLGLSGNDITDIRPLANLTKIWQLNLFNNQISDVTVLKNLTALKELFLHHNQISNVTPLENLTSLTWLLLDGNSIADLAPLRRLKEKIEASGGSIKIDIDINADLNNAPAAPSAPLLPAETALFSNYPNPFNPETWIPYQLATATDVTLTIYDVRGVVVRRLALGHRPPGFYYSRGRAVHWDGRNQLGEKVASGLYFYTFTAGDFTATKKLLIRK